MSCQTLIAILGAGGMLGRAWDRFCRQMQIPARLCDLPQFDLTDPASYPAHLNGADLVINCAAWTDVDGAEDHPHKAHAVNAEGVGRLAGYCLDHSITLVHYSTDYVFDGQADHPWSVDAPTCPCNVYGRTKAEGEQRIVQAGGRYLIIRTSWLYAPWGDNFVLTMARLTAHHSRLKVVNDQQGRPTSALHLVRTTWALLEQGCRGLFHICDGGQCTWYELACRIGRLLGRPCRIEPCTSAEYPRPARRPAYSVLDLSATERVLGPMPHWTQNLADVLEQWEDRS